MSLLSKHMRALGLLDQVDQERALYELAKVQHLNRAELVKAIEVKQDAIRILRIQQAAILATLDTRI